MNAVLNKNYFPQLQAACGVAALLVILNHIYSKKTFFKGIPAVSVESAFVNIGVIGLTMFFVLSGFLITYLLLLEKQNTGSVNIRKFYMRRILRIWPLYFLLIIIGHFILPFILNSNFEGGGMSNFWLKSILYFLILPNYVYIIFKPHNPYIDVTWSIGVEEQFYFVWPQIIKRRKLMLPLIVVLIIIQVLAEIFTHYTTFYKDSSKAVYILNEMVRFVEWTKAGYFAFGAAGAVIYTNESHKNNKVINKIVQYSPLLFVTVFIAATFWYFYLQFILLAVCYSFFQVYLITKKNTVQNFLFTFLNWIGKISYGLYLWYCIVIVFVFKAYNYVPVKLKNQLLMSISLYIIIVGFTIIISWLSYTFFESVFLKLKSKYSISKAPVFYKTFKNKNA